MLSLWYAIAFLIAVHIDLCAQERAGEKAARRLQADAAAQERQVSERMLRAGLTVNPPAHRSRGR